MTANKIYNRAVALLGLSDKDAVCYEETAVSCINQMLTDTLWQQNAILHSNGKEELENAPEIRYLDENIPYDEKMVGECYPYGLAALLVAEEDREEYNRMSFEYETRRLLYMPCYETDIKAADI